MSLFFVVMACGQTSNIDSLELLLKAHPMEDTTRVNLLTNIAFQIYLKDPQKANAYAQKALGISLKLNFRRGQARSLWVSGVISVKDNKQEALSLMRKSLKISEEIDYKVGVCNTLTGLGNLMREMGDIDASNKAYKQALQVAEEMKNTSLIIKVRMNLSINTRSVGNSLETVKQLQELISIAEQVDDKVVLAKCYTSIAEVHNRRGNLPIALKYYILALQLNEKLQDKVNCVSNLINIGGVQSTQGDYDAALESINMALKLSQEQGDSAYMAACFTNIGNVYRLMNKPEALSYFQKALTVLQKINVVGASINCMMNIGSIYAEKGEFAKAMTSFEDALMLSQKTDSKSTICEIHREMATMYFKQKQYGLALTHVQLALSLADQIRYIDVQKDCNLLLSEINAATGNYKSAYEYHTQYKLLYDSIYNDDNARKIALIESNYQFTKERDVYELERSRSELRIKNQRQAIASLAMISLLVVLLSIALYWSARMKKRVLKLEIESINQELEANQKAMAVAQLKLVQNTERDLHNVKMLEDIGKNTAGEDYKNLNSLINNYKLQSNISNWEEFETLFTRVNTSFWDKLNGNYPTLTPNERKLCVFLKLNMNNKDIALITFQSEEALKKSRLRLRKKFNLDRSANLVSFVQCI